MEITVDSPSLTENRAMIDNRIQKLLTRINETELYKNDGRQFILTISYGYRVKEPGAGLSPETPIPADTLDQLEMFLLGFLEGRNTR